MTEKCIVYVSSKLLSNLILEGRSCVDGFTEERRDVCVYIRSCLVTSLKSRFIKCDEPPKWDFEIVIYMSLEQYYFIEYVLTFLYDSKRLIKKSLSAPTVTDTPRCRGSTSSNISG